jgi:hypothetical protein
MRLTPLVLSTLLGVALCADEVLTSNAKRDDKFITGHAKRNDDFITSYVKRNGGNEVKATGNEAEATGRPKRDAAKRAVETGMAKRGEETNTSNVKRAAAEETGTKVEAAKRAEDTLVYVPPQEKRHAEITSAPVA